jgi:hypothetical protein
MEVLRFDFNGSYKDFKRTPQGFLRVNARLTKTGVFDYEQRREYRPDDEVFRADLLESLQGAPVTDLHPSEKSTDSFLTPTNAKAHIVGITESVKRDGPYLKGSLIIFHEDTIKAIESGERKEISLGYKCRLEPTSGSVNGEAYDAVQRDIIVNHVALGPKGWGRAGPDCAIRNDSQQIKTGTSMSELIRLDGVEVAMTPDAIKALFAERKSQVEELRGRLDAMGLELEKEKAARAAAEDPQAVESKVQNRLKLLDKCRRILGDEVSLDGKSDEEIKLMAIKKFYPDVDLSSKDQSYIDGMFEAILSQQELRNDSLTSIRMAIHQPAQSKANQAYEKWVEHSAKLWTVPLSGSLR